MPPARLLEAQLAGRHRAHTHELRIDAGRRVGFDAGQGFDSECFGLAGRHHHDRGGAAVVPGRIYSSVSKCVVPFLVTISTGTISALNLPAFCAASAFCCDAAANSSCARREMSNFRATFSAVVPMW